MIAETTAVSEENLELPSGPVSELKKALEVRYPRLKEQTYRIAIDGKLSEEETLVEANSEIALLPPFAGG